MSTLAAKQKLTRQQREMLAPFGGFWLTMSNAIENKLRDMTDVQLRELFAATNKLTTTNCGWDVFEVSDELRTAIQRETYRRVKAQQPK
jgi:hypothetical protein